MRVNADTLKFRFRNAANSIGWGVPLSGEADSTPELAFTEHR